MTTLADVDKKIRESKFFIEIENELGLDYEGVRSDLLQLSLTDYPAYNKLRKDVIEGITREQTKEAYMTYWRIFKQGVVKKADGSPVQLKMKGENFAPKLADHLINKFAQKAAQTILEIARECVDEIMPENFLNLAQQRQKDLLVAKGMIKG